MRQRMFGDCFGYGHSGGAKIGRGAVGRKRSPGSPAHRTLFVSQRQGRVTRGMNRDATSAAAHQERIAQIEAARIAKSKSRSRSRSRSKSRRGSSYDRGMRYWGRSRR